MTLYEKTIAEAAALLDKGDISSVELTQSVLDRIEKTDAAVGAYLTISAEQALEQAAAADKRIAAKTAGPLTGIPLSIKDLICTKGVRTSCASKMLDNFIPPYDAGVMERLNDAGAVMVGKVNMDEFAMGSTTENSAYQVTRNPWNTDTIPGGSSGGSAASVAADQCLGSLGSDTGGSIRQPASHCGVVGLKPTYGRVSRYGLVAFGSSLDQIGPLSKTVADCALLLQAISGHDPRDSTSVPEPVIDYTAAMKKDLDAGLKGLTIGIPTEYVEQEGLSPDVDAAVKAAIKQMADLGATCVPVSLPHTRYAVAAYYVIAPSEASSNLARYDGVKYGFRDLPATSLMDMYQQTRSIGFGAEVKRRIIIGTYALSAGYYDAYYGKASQVRTLITEDFKNAFTTCDVLLSPVAPTPAFPLGSVVNDPLTLYLSDIFTLSANLAGIPGMSVPCGFSSNGLPIGVQLLGRHFDEGTLLRCAFQYEQAAAVTPKRPEL
ncbi:MAG: Asp-tRNA(Asn)/Glu-tRNA(Gln) amidotransferase GatCAB subunit A [Deltaproteobacteria bacterium]|nr:MAG: Asp-tRNA(Asn)/Glu-tRNA(Gln) amidotransferase GatCAB subunit A [Deltaproteobacteria bacterium]